MDGLKRWKARLSLSFTAATLVLLAAPNVHADGPTNTETGSTLSSARQWNALVERLESDWTEIREELTRSALEASLTAFFGRVGTAPKGPTPTVKEPTPPQPTGGGEPPPPPPPPGGQGETPPEETPPPPPNEAPEPTSMVTALLGVGLASWTAWRRRRKLAQDNRDPAAPHAG